MEMTMKITTRSLILMLGIGVGLGLMSHGHTVSAASTSMARQATAAKCGCHGGATVTGYPGQLVHIQESDCINYVCTDNGPTLLVPANQPVGTTIVLPTIVANCIPDYIIVVAPPPPPPTAIPTQVPPICDTTGKVTTVALGGTYVTPALSGLSPILMGSGLKLSQTGVGTVVYGNVRGPQYTFKFVIPTTLAPQTLTLASSGQDSRCAPDKVVIIPAPLPTSTLVPTDTPYPTSTVVPTVTPTAAPCTCFNTATPTLVPTTTPVPTEIPSTATPSYIFVN